MFEVLVSLFGNLDRILEADGGSLLAIDGMTEEAARRISGAKSQLKEADQLRSRLKELEIDVITRFEDEFPRLLSELNDPPPLLYLRGHPPDNDEKTVALAGAENATNEGIDLTVKAAGAFAAAGVQIVAEAAPPRHAIIQIVPLHDAFGRLEEAIKRGRTLGLDEALQVCPSAVVMPGLIQQNFTRRLTDSLYNIRYDIRHGSVCHFYL